MKADIAAGPACAFPRRYRLTKTDEFSSVFGFKRAIRGRLFMLHYRPRDEKELQEARLGLVVGKKLLKAAVHRNLVKRLIRNGFRCRRAELPACDLIIRLIAKPGRIERKVVADETATLLTKLVQRLAKNPKPPLAPADA